MDTNLCKRFRKEIASYREYALLRRGAGYLSEWGCCERNMFFSLFGVHGIVIPLHLHCINYIFTVTAEFALHGSPQQVVTINLISRNVVHLFGCERIEILMKRFLLKSSLNCTRIEINIPLHLCFHADFF